MWPSGSRCKIADTLASHIAARRDPSHVAHTVADILGARRLARRWVPAFDAASEEMDHIKRGWDFSCAKQMAGGSWVGYLLVMAGYQDQRFAAKIPKRNASNGYASAGRNKKNEGKQSSQAKCSEEINSYSAQGGRLRYDHRVALRVNFS